MSDTLKAFLDSLSSQNTKDLYERGISMFSEFSQKTTDKILEEQKRDFAKRKRGFNRSKTASQQI